MMVSNHAGMSDSRTQMHSATIPSNTLCQCQYFTMKWKEMMQRVPSMFFSKISGRKVEKEVRPITAWQLLATFTVSMHSQDVMITNCKRPHSVNTPALLGLKDANTRTNLSVMEPVRRLTALELLLVSILSSPRCSLHLPLQRITCSD